MSFQFPQSCPSAQGHTWCFLKSAGGLGSTSTQCLLCQTVQKSGSSKVTPTSTVLIYLLFCFLCFFSIRVYILCQQAQEDVMLGPDRSYSPGPVEEAASWALTLGLHIYFSLGKEL